MVDNVRVAPPPIIERKPDDLSLSGPLRYCVGNDLIDLASVQSAAGTQRMGSAFEIPTHK
jgi:hypothetical protein